MSDPDRTGVALPTPPQARVWLLMSQEERAAVHDRAFPHDASRPCPLEAAVSTREDDRSLKVIITIYVLLVAAPGSTDSLRGADGLDTDTPSGQVA